MKTALITGVTGQDGSYLAEILLDKGYRVIGIVRRASTFNTIRIDHLFERYRTDRFDTVNGDMVDSHTLMNAIDKYEPDELYHMAAMSHVKVSFEEPVYTTDVIALGAARLYEAVRTINKDIRIYHASTSEMYGNTPAPHTELGPFNPLSPYASAKMYAHNLGLIYRDSYGMYISNGILFNHSSKNRGETFVTRKITMAAARIKLGLQYILRLGHLDDSRDIGSAMEYCEAMILMLQRDIPDDYVLGTGVSTKVRDMVDIVFNHIGMPLEWVGSGIDEVGMYDGKLVVCIDPIYYRPNELPTLLGNYDKMYRVFGWQPTMSIDDILLEMVDHDIELARRKL